MKHETLGQGNSGVADEQKFSIAASKMTTLESSLNCRAGRGPCWQDRLGATVLAPSGGGSEGDAGRAVEGDGRGGGL